MKSYRFTILIAALCLLLFVKPNKPNMNLSAEQVVQKTEASKTGIRNLVQKTQRAVSHSLRNIVQTNATARWRLEAVYTNIDLPSRDYYLSGSTNIATQQNVNANYFLYRQKDGVGHFSDYQWDRTRAQFETDRLDPNFKSPEIAYGPWERNDSYAVPMVPYADAQRLFAELALQMDVRETERNYLFSLEEDTLDHLDVLLKMNGEDLLPQLGLTMESIRQAKWDEHALRVRFVINRNDMRIQNAHFSLDLKRGSERFIVTVNEEYEQINILGDFTLPSSVPPVPGL